MPIPLNHKFTPVNDSVKLDTKLLNNGKKWITWWYGGYVKNTKADTQPYVKVGFRELLDGQVSDVTQYANIVVTMLGKVRIGSVWQDGKRTKQAQFDKTTFTVDFTRGAWKLTSLEDAQLNNYPLPFDKSIYPLEWDKDKNWLLQFPLDTGGNLIIPCFEYYTRCYGVSGELKRLLVTYPWNTLTNPATSRLYAPLPEGEIDDGSVWKVKLRRRLYNGDVVLLAHAKYDSYTATVIKSIHNQIEAKFDSKLPEKSIFVKIAPWFEGQAQLSVKGIWFNNNKSFLALNIIGSSEPDGVLVERDRDNTNKTNIPAQMGSEESWNGVALRNITPKGIVDLTSDVEPDHGAPIIEIQDPDFEILGRPRQIRDVVRERAKTVGGKLTNGIEANAYSSGDPYGTQKDVGLASIHSTPVLESDGALRDMWNAMLHLKQKFPTSVTSVEWLSHDGGYKSDTDFNLISLSPFAKEEAKDMAGEIRNWPYYDVATQRLRGALIMRILIKGEYVHLIEIQRRSRKKENDAGLEVDSEESYKGFVFKASSSNQADETIEYFKTQIRYAKGIVSKITKNCPSSNCDTFKHNIAKDDAIPCESAVRRALEKMGIIV